jgi:hypothetical protein
MANSDDQAGRVVQASSLRELAHDIQPSRDLWPDIHARLPMAGRGAEASDGRPHSVFDLRAPWTRIASLAAVVALLGVGIWIGRGTRPFHEAAEEELSIVGPSMLQITHITDPQYLRERAELLRTLPRQIAALPPESQAQVKASLATIHKAMQDIEAALGRDSSSALLQELLINTCQDEMRVLMAVHEASGAGNRI